MKKLAAFFIDNYKLTIVLSFFVVVWGLQSLFNLKSETRPQVDFAMANITTIYRGASAEDVETKVTKPIEDELRTISGLKDVRSVSQAGRSNIFVRVDMDNVPDTAKVINDIQKAVDRVSNLPKELEDDPEFTELKSEEMPVLDIAIIGSNKDRKRDLVADLLKEEIEDNKRVLEVVPSGYRERRFQILLQPDKMQEFNIGINELLDKIQARNVSIPGGNLKEQTTEALVRLEGKIKNSREIEDILVRSNFSGKKVYVRDVAKVFDSEEEAKILTSYNGQPATLLTVKKKGGQDTLKLVAEVDKVVKRFKKLYPEFKFIYYHNEGVKVSDKLKLLSSNALSGLVLVFIFLLLFLPGRIGIVASMSLPLAVMATLGVMNYLGTTINTITVLALVIALGMLVDNSVVISENYTRLRREGKSRRDAALDSIISLWLPISATAFTTIAAFLPMLVTKGIMGRFIKFIPIIVTAALLISLLESFFLLPMRLIKVDNQKDDEGLEKEDWFTKLQSKFEHFMEICINRRYLVGIGLSALLVVSFLFMFKFNKFILFPPEQTELYIARLETPVGTRVEQTRVVLNHLMTDIKNKLGKDAKHIVGWVGNASYGASDPKAKTGSNVGLVMIYVSDYAKYNRKAAEVLETLREIKRSDLSVLTFEAKINGPPVGDPITATFRSNDLEKLNTVIDLVKERLSKVDGVIDLKVDDVIGDDEVFIHLDYAKVDQLGLLTSQIGNIVSAAVSGKKVSTVTLNNKEVDLMVRLDHEYKRNVEDLGRIMIMDRRGNLIPLSKIATFERKRGSVQIKRFDYKRAKTLNGDIIESKITSRQANKKLKEIFHSISHQYPEVSLVFGGQAESTKESMDSLKEALVLSLIGIFGIMVFIFNSFLRPFIIMTTIPLGLVGVSIAFYFHHRPMSFLSFIGVIGLGGIIVNSGIVLISFIEDLRAEGKLSLHDILVKSSGMRLRAVLVTSLTTISGLLPTAYGIGGSDNILVPMTLAMAWGLTSGTFLTLVWVPCAYAIFEDITDFFRRLFFKRGGNVSAN